METKPAKFIRKSNLLVFIIATAMPTFYPIEFNDGLHIFNKNLVQNLCLCTNGCTKMLMHCTKFVHKKTGAEAPVFHTLQSY